MTRSLATRAAKVRLLVLDVDGVLTDGTLVYGSSGEEVKRFHVRDGYALVVARRMGLAVAVISGRASAAVTRRLAELEIPGGRRAGSASGRGVGLPTARRTRRGSGSSGNDPACPQGLAASYLSVSMSSFGFTGSLLPRS